MVAVHEARAATPSKRGSPQRSPTNVIDVLVDGVRTYALVDTGAAVSVMDAKLCRFLRKVTTPIAGLALRTAGAQRIHPIAACTARVLIEDVVYAVEFIVISSCSHEVILGWDFLARHDAVIHCARAELELSPISDMTLADNASFANKLLVRHDTNVPPNSSVIVSMHCSSLSDAIALLSPSGHFYTRKGLLLPFATVNVKQGSTAIFVCNPFSYPVMLLQGECLGHVEVIDAVQITDVPEDTSCASYNTLGSLSTSDPLPTGVFDSSIADGLTPPQRSQLLRILEEFRSSFDVGQPSLGRASAVTHHIDTGSQPPLRQRPYRVSATERRVINEQVDDMLRREVIRPSNSPWASPVVLVTKKTARYGSV